MYIYVTTTHYYYILAQQNLSLYIAGWSTDTGRTNIVFTDTANYVQYELVRVKRETTAYNSRYM